MTIMTEARLRIGIDVGGTNTDCVLLDPTKQRSQDRGIISSAKTLTTTDITSGIFKVIQLVIDQSKVDPKSIALVTIGTTHFLNAIIERDHSRLDKVAIIRLSSNFTRSVPPFSDFPEDLKDAIYGYHGFVSGGLQIDGALISKINEDEIVEQCHEIAKRDLKSVVIAGVYSPLDNLHYQEYKAREIVQRELPNVRIVCSRDVGTIGFLERENASILNASILRFSEYVIKGFKSALKNLGLTCPLYLTQNDGTIIPAEAVKKIPIVTFSSGPTNSILGAAYLSQAKSDTSMLVADVGGTTTDIGILLPSGFPKQASAYLSIAGVRVNYAMPHVHTIGLGGGSIVVKSNGTQANDDTTVGPESVGLSLTKNALVFGGTTLTATDIAVLAKSTHIEGGDVSKLAHVDQDIVTSGFKQIQTNLSKAIDAIRTSPVDLPLILVGGGSMIIGDELKGISKIIRPAFHEYANAVGAAVAKIATVVDTVVSTDSGISFEQILDIKKQEAIESIIKEKGAIRESTYIADVSSLSVPYAINKVRVSIKVAGEVDLNRANEEQEDDDDLEDQSLEESFKFQRTEIKKSAPVNSHSELSKKIHVLDYRPNVQSGIWNISQTDLKWIANGCYVLGCAGGGSPQVEYLEVRNLLKNGYEIKLQDYSSISDDDYVGWGGIMGSPAVSYERLGGTDTVDALEQILKYTKTDIKALMCLEIGGANGLQSFIIASSKHSNKPLLDCDWMGRAYPTYYQTTLAAHTEGLLAPAAISDGVGNSLLLTTTNSDMFADVILRASCGEMGSRVGYSGRPTEGSLVKQFAVKNSYSLAWRIGRQIALCQQNNCTDQVVDNIINEVGGTASAKKLFAGKIISVEQKLYKGHEYGQIVISAFGFEEQDGSKSDIPYEETEGIVRIPYKNEIMYAEHEFEGVKKTLASVPDLISVIDSQSGQAIGVPEFKFGLRVVVIGIAGSDLWTDSEKSRKLGGLDAFGLADRVEHKPLGVYNSPRSVIEEYNRI